MVAGLHSQSEDSSFTQSIPVVEKIVHPNYPGANGIANDVALLRLEFPLQLDGAYVNFACMPEQNQSPPEGQVQISKFYLLIQTVLLLLIKLNLAMLRWRLGNSIIWWTAAGQIDVC